MLVAARSDRRTRDLKEAVKVEFPETEGRETQEMDEGGKKNLIFATNGRKEGRGDLWEAFGGDLCEAKVAAAEGWVARRGICVAAGAIRSEMATGGNGVLKP
jgi:hypothetical protein